MPTPTPIVAMPESPASNPPVPEAAEPVPAVRICGIGRSLALGILATIATVFALDWAQPFAISILLGILFAYTLNPMVVWLERIGLPRVAGASLVIMGIVCALLLGIYALRGEVQTILDQLPQAVSKLSASLTSSRKGEASTMQKVQSAASEIEKATSPTAATAPPPGRSTTRIVIDSPGFKIGNFLWAGSMGVAGVIGQVVMELFLTFFLLLSGNTYKRKLVLLSGSSLSNRKITVHILDDINESIQRYMFMLLVTNVLVGLLTWLMLRWIGVENAGAWAVAAGMLHVIPYFGPVITAAGIGMAAFLQFDEISTALLAVGTSLAIATVVGTLITTWMTGKIARMNKAAVFITLLFWAWLWGVWGLLLSVPITVIMKVVAEHMEPLQPLARLLED